MSLLQSNEPSHPVGGHFIRDIVFGANDGVVTSIGFLVGLSSTLPQAHIVVIGGMLTIIAGAASMALGNYLATKSEKEYYQAQAQAESWEIEHKPEQEVKEVRQVFIDQGFLPDDVDKIASHIVENRKLWLDILMKYELGMIQTSDDKHPVRAGLIMGSFYLAAGIPPLIPYLLVGTIFPNVYTALFAAIAVALIVLIIIGTIRVYLNKSQWTRTIVETIIIGIMATLVGFLAGVFINALGIEPMVA